MGIIYLECMKHSFFFYVTWRLSYVMHVYNVWYTKQSENSSDLKGSHLTIVFFSSLLARLYTHTHRWYTLHRLLFFCRRQFKSPLRRETDPIRNIFFVWHVKSLYGALDSIKSVACTPLFLRYSHSPFNEKAHQFLCYVIVSLEAVP